MIGRLTLACCALAGCARAVDDQPHVLVTLDSITVTSVDSGQPAMGVYGVVSAATTADEVRLFEYEATNPVSLAANVAWPTAGDIIADGVVTIPADSQDEIELRYDANDVSAKVSLPYVEAMQEQISLEVHNAGTIVFQFSVDDLTSQ